MAAHGTPQSPVTCAFVHPDCPHTTQPLFSSEYKRTNRTRATKIVRCFPHCCPEHRPRSYCGTSLHVKVSATANSDSVAAELTDQLHVYGRFEIHQPHERADSEEEGSTPLTNELILGQRVRAAEITETPATIGSIWVKGERVDRAGQEFADEEQTSTRVFALQGSSDEFHHWESDWKSGTSQHHRQTPHHFRVYVFAQSERDPEEWQVVASVVSPPFTFAVYRKHQHDPELLRLKELQAAQAEEQAYVSGDDNEDHIEAEETDDLAHDNQGLLPPEVLRDLLWHRQHRSAAMNSTNIAILVLLAYEGDPTWLAAQSRSLFTLLEAATSAASVPTHLVLHYINHSVPQFVSLLPRQAERLIAPQRWASDESATSTGQAMMETIAELACFILDPALTKPVLAFVSAHACLPVLTDEKRRELLLQWIDMITEQIDSFFQRRGQSTESFVDDVVSVALRKSTGATKYLVRDMLRNTRVLGQEHFSALLAKLRLDAHADDQPTGLASTADDKWAGRWLCRGFARSASEGRPERRRSWPLASSGRPRVDSSDGSFAHVGMMTAIAAILVGVGFDLKLCGDQGDTLRVDPLATVLDKPNLQFPLDHVFRDATNLLSLEWAALLMTGGSRKHIFCRARTTQSGTSGDDDELELEFFTFHSDAERPMSWRCLLRFEIPSARGSHGFLVPPAVLQRRRLILHVRVDEAQMTESQSQNHGYDDDRSDDSEDEETDHACKHSDSGSSTESDLPARHRVASENEEASAQDGVPRDEPLRLHARVPRWHTQLAFQSIYYALE